jgi:hypothetical protein
VLAAKLGCYLLAKLKFRKYEPQPITFRTIGDWLDQFGNRTQWQLLTLLRQIRYLSDRETRRALSELNRLLLEHLRKSGIQSRNVIYVQIDEAGSSSHWVLNMLRHYCPVKLQGAGCK